MVLLLLHLVLLLRQLLSVLSVLLDLLLSHLLPLAQKFNIILLCLLFDELIIFVHFPHQPYMPLMHLLHILFNLDYMLLSELDGQQVGLSGATVHRGLWTIPRINFIIVHLTLVISHVSVVTVVILIIGLVVKNQVPGIGVVPTAASGVRP